jgi:hypothetical protein
MQCKRDYLPPYIFFKALHFYSSWCSNGPEDAGYNISNSGWMEDQQFFEWFNDMFLKYTNSKEPRILFLDGHSSHISLKLIDLAKEHNVHIICLPPHTTHALQPLDVAVFKPAKATWS